MGIKCGDSVKNRKLIVGVAILCTVAVWAIVMYGIFSGKTADEVQHLKGKTKEEVIKELGEPNKIETKEVLLGEAWIRRAGTRVEVPFKSEFECFFYKKFVVLFNKRGVVKYIMTYKRFNMDNTKDIRRYYNDKRKRIQKNR